MKTLRNEIVYLQYLMTIEKIDLQKQNEIIADIEQSEILIQSMANE